MSHRPDHPEGKKDGIAYKQYLKRRGIAEIVTDLGVPRCYYKPDRGHHYRKTHKKYSQ